MARNLGRILSADVKTVMIPNTLPTKNSQELLKNESAWHLYVKRV